DLGSSDDLDLWLLWAAAEYGLASRDLSFFDKPVRYSDGTTGSMWEHLKLAYQHQESQLGPHGGYVTGGTGDWSDFSTQFLQMTESTLVSAQTAIGGNAAVYVGGTWFAVNGWLTWALGTLDRVVPHAAAYAFDEFKRNTLAKHGAAFPRHWDGILSVDDVCNSFYASKGPANCGNGLSTSYEGQIMHQ